MVGSISSNPSPEPHKYRSQYTMSPAIEKNIAEGFRGKATHEDCQKYFDGFMKYILDGMQDLFKKAIEKQKERDKDYLTGKKTEIPVSLYLKAFICTPRR